ncbi:uncharacterized protein Z519_09404 [Cladophialophora bantiana CBS 173.52]|uniref:Uncharacterized protein n=1 Tax=Cladophialophora bantiana (strain ATCC 10958 / CBS 173.52 / CDC B-1940 / NIH 8579) TaxID=1442370 RepID=A0A0D2HZJ0_CLAB1|nr:uncharacterized protein Z519_09404 [Cladophialophora bantiana CBS 173.52]KIW89974.1 hypothetical protein Z519_09404 [Cladophialophora bantiana CBS 173.52]
MRSLPQEWERLVLVLAAQLTPGRLRLSVVCDTLDHAAALQVLLPLERLPLLRSCAVRLGQQSDHHLRRLAQTTVHQVTGQLRPPQTAFQWDDLPDELQTPNTDSPPVITPRTIEWVEGKGITKPSCCQQCTATLEAYCCPPLHAAFTSGRCTCWQWPRDHFLVNHKFRLLALQIFYRSNTFSVETLDARWDRDISRRLEHRSALVFLQSMPHDALSHIYSLRIIFPTFHDDSLCPGTPSLPNWTDTLRFIQRHLPLAYLDLTLCIAFANQDDGFVTPCEDKEWAFYLRMVEPAVILRGIRNLVVTFPPTGDAPQHDGLRKDGQPDQRVNQQGFAYGKVDPHEAGKKGGQTSGTGSSDSSSAGGSDNPQGAAHLGGEGLRKDGEPDQRLKMNQDSSS